MADKELVSTIRNGTADLAELYHADLQDANLEEANLEKADLKKADLREANLQGANLCEADLYGAHLQGAHLQGANMRGVKLQEANLRGVKLQKANLQGAELAGAYLKFAAVDNKTKIDLPQGYEIRAWRIVPTDENEHIDPPPTNKTRKETIATIGARLAEAPKRYATETGDFASLFDAQINWWKSKKPNEEDKIEEWQKHYEFLLQIRDAFNDLTAKIKKLEEQSTPENQQDAGEQAFTLQEKLRDAFTDTISDKRKNLALLSIIGGATVVISGIIGVNPNLAFVVSTAAIGGGKLAETVGKLMGKLRGKSPKSKGEPSDDEEDS